MVIHYNCLICNKPVDDYVPDYCCSGAGHPPCYCMGQPLNPCVCSNECDEALYKFIGMSYEQRRIKANIKLYKG